MRRCCPGHVSGLWLLPPARWLACPEETAAEATRRYRAAAENYPDDFPEGAWHAGLVFFARYGPHDLAWNAIDGADPETADRPVYDLCPEEG